MTSIGDPLDKRTGYGVRVVGYIDEQRQAPQTGRSLLRSLGIRPKRHSPAQARAKGGELVLRSEAHKSAAGRPSRGATRGYLEREDAAPDVLHEAKIEDMGDRWSMWISPSEFDVNPMVAAKVLTDELCRRYGLAEDDVYVVQHHDPDDPTRWHLHAVVPAVEGMNLDRKTMAAITKVMVRELVLERAVERALERVAEKPASGAQVDALSRSGKVPADLSRDEAAMVFAALKSKGLER